MSADWLYTTDEFGETPLSRVAKSGHTEVSRLLILQEVNDNYEEADKMPALHQAAYWGLQDAVSVLLDEGADPTEADAQGETPLHKAVRLGKSETVKTLLEAGAETDLPNDLGLTALHWAALLGREDITEMLLDHGASPHVRDWVSGGRTPVDFARCMGYTEIVQLIENSLACY